MKNANSKQALIYNLDLKPSSTSRNDCEKSLMQGMLHWAILHPICNKIAEQCKTAFICRAGY